MKYIFIACQGHSGSTLLSKLLSLHEEGLSVGEVKHFANYYAKNDACGCGQALQSCPFWAQALASGQFPKPLDEEHFPMEGVRGQYWINLFYFFTLFSWPWLYRWLSRVSGSLQAINRRNAQNHWTLIQAASATSGKSLIIDKSMSISRYYEIFLSRPANVDFLLVHLVRDGRANMYSYMTRYAYSAQRAAKRWQRINRKIEATKLLSPGHNILELRYEDLIASPERICRQIFQQIGLDYKVQLDDLAGAFDHSIGSNEDKLVGYQKIRIDRRWEDQLNEDELAIFEKTAGKLNKKYGYR